MLFWALYITRYKNNTNLSPSSSLKENNSHQNSYHYGTIKYYGSQDYHELDIKERFKKYKMTANVFTAWWKHKNYGIWENSKVYVNLKDGESKT